jgi:hypothetical protein
VAPGVTPSADVLNGLHDPDAAWVGFSALPAGGWIAKIVAADSITLRDRLSRMRDIFYAASGMPMPCVRRVTGGIMRQSDFLGQLHSHSHPTTLRHPPRVG